MSTITLILLAVAGLIIAVTTIWMIVLGFQRHWGWGLALLVPQLLGWSAWLLPGATVDQSLLAIEIVNLLGLVIFISFLVVAWPEAKRPFFWLLATIPLVFVAMLSVPSGGDGFSFSGGPKGLSYNILSRLSPSLGTPGKGVFVWPGSRPEAEEQPPPQVSFRSKLPPPTVPPGQPEPAPPGTFYLLERVTATTASGFHAANAGEKVTLLQRMPGNKLRVTIGNADFVVKSSQVTDDLNVVRELEKQEFVARGGQF